MGHTYRYRRSHCDDGVRAGIYGSYEEVPNLGARRSHILAVTVIMESVDSSPSLLNEYLWYDKLWGPSQRVVTLFISNIPNHA